MPHTKKNLGEVEVLIISASFVGLPHRGVRGGYRGGGGGLAGMDGGAGVITARG